MRNNILWIFKNPVFIKELWATMRQRRVYTILTAYLIILGFGFYLSYGTNLSFFDHIYYTKPDLYTGKSIFTVLAILQILLVITIPLTFSTTSITLEKEERTYNLLRVTPLTPNDIIMGKLLFSLSYIFLLLIASIPIAFMIPYLGGLSFIQVLKVCVIIMITSMTISLFGIYCSSTFSKSSYATGIFYGILFFSILLPSLFGGCFQIEDSESIWAAVIANPFWTILAVLENDMTQIFQFKMPIWLLYLVSSLLLSWFIGTLTAANLQIGKRCSTSGKRHTIWIRLSFLIFFLFITVIGLGSLVLIPLTHKPTNNFEVFISFQVLLFIFVVWLFSFGKVSERLSFDFRKILYHQPSTSLLYIIALVVSFSIITFGGAYWGKIFPNPYLLFLISIGMFMITLGWCSLGLLINSLFRNQLASRGLFLFIFILIIAGEGLPGMPHCLHQEQIGLIGNILLHLNPIISLCCLIDTDRIPEIISETNLTFFWNAMFYSFILFLVNIGLLGLFQCRINPQITQISQIIRKNLKGTIASKP
ncbi:MAG: hypothetical protein ABH870_01455 [bacterium]